MVERVSMRRTEEVRLKLGSDMLGRLNSLADAYGFPVATMGAMAVAEWVVGKETAKRNQQMMLMDVSRKMTGDIAKMFEVLSEDPEFLAASEAVAQKAKDQLNLPLNSPGGES